MDSADKLLASLQSDLNTAIQNFDQKQLRSLDISWASAKNKKEEVVDKTQFITSLQQSKWYGPLKMKDSENFFLYYLNANDKDTYSCRLEFTRFEGAIYLDLMKNNSLCGTKKFSNSLS